MPFVYLSGQRLATTLDADGNHVLSTANVSPAGSSGDTLTLLTDASATGDSASWEGGSALWSVAGTFGGAVAQLQYDPFGDGTWMDYSKASLSAAGGFLVDLPAGPVRVTITGGSGTSLDSNLKRV